jgi:hypothetical protein
MNRISRLGRLVFVSAVCGAGALALVSPASAQDDADDAALVQEIVALDAMFPAFATMPWKEKDRTLRGFLHGDTKGVVHLTVADEGQLREKWRSFPLEGQVKEVFGADLDRDGTSEIIAYTTKARIYVWETQSFKLLWESVQEKFKAIQAMLVADVDRDATLELVVCGDNRILYYDGVEFFLEKEGRDAIDPAWMLIADVDGDLVNEIVTNDGYVMDSVTLNIEWSTDGFGYPISLFDIDNDGIFEVVGQIGGSVVIFDIEERREIW